MDRLLVRKHDTFCEGGWVVECSFAWITRGRQLARDHEGRPESSEAFSMLSASRRMLSLLAPAFAEVSVRIGKVSSQIGLECGFVAFDQKKRIGVLRTQKAPKLTVGMQRIKGTDASTNG